MKSSGLSKIAKRLTKNSTFYIGTDFYITEPRALKRLIKSGHTVYLTKKAKSTFHPKIYYSLKGNNISILTGSANLTGGGLETNFEVSVLFQTEIGSSIDKDFKKLINVYSTHSTEITGELQLSQYEREFEAYRKKHKKADKEFKEEISKTHKIDLSKLDKFVKEYLNTGGLDRFSERAKYYKTAKRLLNSLTKKNITSAEDFLYYYDDIAKSFHSSGLLRGKTTFAEKHKAIIKLIKLIQENKNKRPEFVFSITLPLVKSIKRFGVNALTEIMNTYNPNKFSVANGRTLNSLTDLGFAKFPQANNFNIDIYEKYNDLITEIAVACNFKDLGQVDHFLSWYYEQYVKE
ncbi:MAG: phospholipase D-like domain-containing protein [Psychroserpens sp.]|uniref:phospholipase D-like domain-containing protein n=1 Tax=Psychroserpens sp. TaxID=2020870 RepID=UPI0030020F32